MCSLLTCLLDVDEDDSDWRWSWKDLPDSFWWSQRCWLQSGTNCYEEYVVSVTYELNCFALRFVRLQASPGFTGVQEEGRDGTTPAVMAQWLLWVTLAHPSLKSTFIPHSCRVSCLKWLQHYHANKILLTRQNKHKLKVVVVASALDDM